jgi:multiple antibiotic resistance protein
MSWNLSAAFVTLFITIGPVETAAIFASLTKGPHKAHRRSLAVRAVVIAGAMLLVFALGGNLALSLLHITLPAFKVAGGILLFLQALTLTFSSPGLSSISAGEQREAEGPGDIAVFPLAFPVMAGPGSLSAVILLMGRAGGLLEAGAIVSMLILCLALTLLAMLAADRLTRLLGETGTDVVGRISGMLLAALAVQFVFDGLYSVGVLPAGAFSVGRAL